MSSFETFENWMISICTFGVADLLFNYSDKLKYKEEKKEIDSEEINNDEEKKIIM